jgi:uncharacterized protein HemY
MAGLSKPRVDTMSDAAVINELLDYARHIGCDRMISDHLTAQTDSTGLRIEVEFLRSNRYSSLVRRLADRLERLEGSDQR